MNRLRVLKQRAGRGLCGVFYDRYKREWLVGSGRGQGDCFGPYVSYREAIQAAARIGMPHKRVAVYINGIRVD